VLSETNKNTISEKGRGVPIAVWGFINEISQPARISPSHAFLVLSLYLSEARAVCYIARYRDIVTILSYRQYGINFDKSPVIFILYSIHFDFHFLSDFHFSSASVSRYGAFKSSVSLSYFIFLERSSSILLCVKEQKNLTLCSKARLEFCTADKSLIRRRS